MIWKIPLSTVLREWYITFVIAHAQILCGCTLSYSAFLIPRLIEEGHDKDLVKQWIGSIVNVAASVLVFFVAPLLGTFGRKLNLQILFVINIFGWICLMVASNFLCICISLCMLSFAMVMTIPLAVTYISETCDKTRRGLLLSLDFVFISIGNAVDYILDAYLPWRVVALIFIIIATLGLFLCSRMPETKYWYLLKGDWKNAIISHSWFQPLATSKGLMLDLVDIQKSIDEDKKLTFLTFLKDIKKKKYFKGLLLGLLLYVFRVCAGKSIFVSFTVNVFKNMKTPYNSEHLAIFYGIFDIIGCIIVQYLVHKCNRKSLILYFSTIMISSLASATVYLYFQNFTGDLIPWFPVACVYIYDIIVSTGYISTIGIMVSEIVYAEYRGPTMTFVTFGLFFTTFLLTKLYAQFDNVIPIEYVFIFFIFNIILCVLVIFLFIPETVNTEFYKTGF